MRTTRSLSGLWLALVVSLLPSCSRQPVALTTAPAEETTTTLEPAGDPSESTAPEMDEPDEVLFRGPDDEAAEEVADGLTAEEAAAEEKDPLLIVDNGGHMANITEVLFHPDGRRLISVSHDKTIRIWDLETGESKVLRMSQGTFGIGGGFLSAALAPDGKTLAICRDNSVLLIDLDTEVVTHKLTGHEKPLPCVTFSPDGSLIASASRDHTARIWKVAEGTHLHTLDDSLRRVEAVAFSPNGKLVATIDNGVKQSHLAIWSVEMGAKTKQFGHTDLMHSRCLAWHPDGKSVAIGTEKKGVLYNLADHSHRSFEAEEQCEITSVEFTADGKRLLYSYGQPARAINSGSARFRDLISGTESEPLVARTVNATRATQSPDGKTVAVATKDHFRIFLVNAADGQEIQRLGGSGTFLALAEWGRNGKSVSWAISGIRGKKKATGGGTRLAFDLAKLEFLDANNFKEKVGSQKREHAFGELRASKEDNQLKLMRDNSKLSGGRIGTLIWHAELKNKITHFALVSSTRAVVTSGSGRVPELLDVNAKKTLKHYLLHQGTVTSITRDPSDRYFLTTCEDQCLRIYDWKGSEYPLLTLYAEKSAWIVWTKEGYYAASPEGEQLVGWHVNRGEREFADYYAADQFRKKLHRPDVIRRVLETGSVAEALKQANAERGGTNDADAAPTTIAAILPPIVRFLEPAQPRIKVRESTLTVRAVAQGRHASQPVTRMQLLIEGRPAADSRAATTAGAEPGQMVMSWPVALVPGKQRLQVLAEGVSQGRSEELEIEYEPEVKGKDFFKPRLYVLAIGINAYANPGLRLRCAVNDATELQATFEKHSRGSVFREVHVKRLVDGEANREGFLGGLQWLAEQPLTRQDVVVMFFAGHGDMDEQKQFYLLPQDVQPKQLGTTAVPGALLQKTLVQLQSKVLLMLDACHSGRIDALGELRRELSSYEAGVVVMCAADESTQAGEKEGHGYFAKALIEGLSGQATRHRTDRSIYLNSLDAYVDERVRDLSLDQQRPVTAKPGSIHSFPLSQPAEARPGQ